MSSKERDLDFSRRVRELFEAAVDLPREQRDDFLRGSTADSMLRGRVSILLERAESADGFLEEVDDLEPDWRGRILGSYRLGERIGRGGTSTVYLGERVGHDFEHRVAVKLLRRDLGSGETRARFRRERRILALLEHPSIARLIDGGTTEEGVPYLVMEYVEGAPITEYCDGRRLPLRRRIELFRVACEAVHYAHSHLIVHRDIKPSNLIVTDDGLPKLLDFGVAKLIEDESLEPSATETRHRILTPNYASPEHLSGRRITVRSDVYSLGVLLYELLCGERPHDWTGLSLGEILQRLEQERPEPPSRRALRRRRESADAHTDAAARGATRSRSSRRDGLSRRLRGDLDSIVLKTLQVEPAERYGSVEALADDLERYLDGRTVEAHTQSLTYRTAKYLRRHPARVAGMAVVVLLAVATTVQSLRLLQERNRALGERARMEAISEFLVQSFRVADPNAGPVNGLTAREIVDDAVRRLEDELSEQPMMQATLRQRLGVIYHNLGLYPEARRQLEKAAAELESTLGPHDPGTVRAWLDLAATLDAAGQHDDAAARARQALSALDATASGGALAADAHRTLATALMHAGRSAEAAAAARRAVALFREHADPEPLASGLSVLTLTLEQQGDYDAAITAGEEALALARRVHGELHPVTGTAFNNLAIPHYRMGRYERAAEYYRKALEIGRRHLGPEHPETAAALNNLGLALVQMGDLVSAEPILLEALELRRRTLGEHPLVALSLNNLAHLRWQQGRYAEAEDVHREVVDLHVSLSGERHPSTGRALNNLGNVVHARGDLLRAAELESRGLAIWRESLGDLHPELASVLNNLATIYLDLGHWQEARRHAEEAISIARAATTEDGADHPYLAGSLNTLGHVLESSGRYAEAEGPYLESREMLLRLFGEEHAWTAINLGNIGSLRTRQGRVDEALPFLRDAQERILSALGPNHPNVPMVTQQLAVALRKSGATDEAEELLRRVLADRRRLLGEGHFLVGFTLLELADLRRSRGRADEAIELARRARMVLERSLPADHWLHAMAASVSGGCLAELGRTAKAEPLLRSAYAELQRLKGEQATETLDSRSRLAVLLR